MLISIILITDFLDINICASYLRNCIYSIIVHHLASFFFSKKKHIVQTLWSWEDVYHYKKRLLYIPSKYIIEIHRRMLSIVWFYTGKDESDLISRLLLKVGGLGDVLTGLSKALQQKEHLVEIILPKYDCMQYEHVEDLRASSLFWSQLSSLKIINSENIYI